MVGRATSPKVPRCGKPEAPYPHWKMTGAAKAGKPARFAGLAGGDQRGGEVAFVISGEAHAQQPRKQISRLHERPGARLAGRR